MGSAASAENRSRLQYADRAEFFKIYQEISRDTQEEDLSEEHRQLLLKALEVQDTKEIKESASDALCEKELYHVKEDMRCIVERMLQSTLEESHGILPRESWIQFVKVIGGREQDAEALLKEQKSHLRVEEFLNIIFEPQEIQGSGAADEQKETRKIAVTDNLREYFEKCFRQGGKFCHPDYEDTSDADLHTWLHRPTGIQVWRDAIDLTAGEGGRVYFHYTSQLAFRNITAPSKKAAEVWASLNSDPGPKQNAWWGKGVYSVHLPPGRWRDREQLLDNNFRNMMLRDLAAPHKGPEYVQEEYPKRVAFCVPILIDAADAYDISIRATPEMEAAGKEPGRNLGDKLLNEPGKPPRCCVVLRVNDEDGVKHAQGQLLDALRRRAASGDVFAKSRLGDVLRQRGLYDEALPVMQETLQIFESKEGPESVGALAAMQNLAVLLQQMGRLGEAVELQRRSLEATEARFGPMARTTLNAMNSLANTLSHMGKYTEALELHQKALEIYTRTLGAEHPDTLTSMNNLAATLQGMGQDHEAAKMHRKAVEIMERTLGSEHPDTLLSMLNVGMVLRELGNCREAENLHRRALAVKERTLGAEHPETLDSVTQLAVTLHRLGELNEALELQRRAVGGRTKILGPEHPQTQKCRQRVEDLMRDLSLKEIAEDD